MKEKIYSEAEEFVFFCTSPTDRDRRIFKKIGSLGNKRETSNFYWIFTVPQEHVRQVRNLMQALSSNVNYQPDWGKD